MSDPGTQPHLEHLLGAYALHALDSQEAQQVESHLAVCPLCQESLSQLERGVATLGLAVPQQQPPPGLRARIMAGLPPQEAPRPSSLQKHSADTLIGRVSAWALPVAAGIVIILLGLSIAMNLQISERVDRLEQENSTFATRLDQSIAETTQIQDSIRQVRSTSYLIARPDTHPLFLESPGGTGSSQGVLLVANGGQRAILMVAGMGQPPPSTTYQVWFVRQGQRVPVGRLVVDETGWGTLTLIPPEPVFLYDWVGLTVESLAFSGSSKEEMILRSKIVSPEGAK